VDNGWSRLVILLLGDPHLLKRGQRGQDGAADPDRVFALGRRNDLDLHGARRQRRNLLLHAIRNTRVHGSATREYIVGIQILSDIDIALHDRVERGLMNASHLHAQERRLEQSLRASKSLVTNRDDLTVGQLVALLQSAR